MRLQMKPKGGPQIASLSFNGDLTCLACGTAEGYGIYLTMPLERYCFRSFAGGGFSIVEMFGQVISWTGRFSEHMHGSHLRRRQTRLRDYTRTGRVRVGRICAHARGCR